MDLRQRVGNANVFEVCVQHGDFSFRIAGELVDGDDDRPAEVFQAVDVGGKVIESVRNSLRIFLAKVCFFNTAVVFERTNGRDKHNGGGRQPRHAAFNIEEFFAAEIGAEAGFCNTVVAELKRKLCRHNGVASVGNICERPAVHKAGRAFYGLDEVGLNRILKQGCKRTLHAEIAAEHGLVVIGVADQDAAEPLFEVFNAGGKAEDRHHLGGDGNHEPVVARTPSNRLPSPIRIWRSARSFISSARLKMTFSGSMFRGFPW